MATNLTDEPLFYSTDKVIINRIGLLNNHGILTVEDFMAADLTLFKTPHIRTYFNALQKILRYKYLGTPISTDYLLDEYVHLHLQDYRDCMSKLGIHLKDESVRYMASRFSGVPQNTPVRIINLLKEISNAPGMSQQKALAQIYVQYYGINKAIDETTQITPEILEELKRRISMLSQERDDLDKKIAKYTELVRDYEGDKIRNDR